MSTDLYPETVTSITTSDLWATTSDGREIDLREEFRTFLHGSGTEIAKGRIGVLRRMRRDDDGTLVQCPCVDEKTKEPDRDTICPYCSGEGFLWDEEWIVYYKKTVGISTGITRKNQAEVAGITNIPYVFFYLEYFVEPTLADKLIEMALDVDGGIITPYKREAIYKIATPEGFRSDNGRVEYWRCAGTKEPVKSTWQ